MKINLIFMALVPVAIFVSTAANAAVWTLRTQMGGSLQDVGTYSSSSACGKAATKARKANPKHQYSCFKTKD